MVFAHGKERPMADIPLTNQIYMETWYIIELVFQITGRGEAVQTMETIIQIRNWIPSTHGT